MNGPSTARDVAGIALPPNVTWSDTEFRKCPHCGRLTPVPIVSLGGRRHPFIPYPCDCDGAKAHRRRFDEAEEKAKMRAASKSSSLPKIYEDVIGGLDAGDYAASVKEKCGLYFFGLAGRGKTAMAYAIADRLKAEGWTVEVVKMDDVQTALSDTFSTADTKGEIIGRLTRCGLLILDDLGNEKLTRGLVPTVLRLVDARCEAKRPIVVTSNYAQVELGRHYAAENPVAAKSIISRLMQMTVPIEVEGPDRRVAG